MGRGGQRSGAGRKAGVPNKRKTILSVKMLVEGHSSLEIMLTGARKMFAAAEKALEEGDIDLSSKLYAAAGMLAARAAPYQHQKFAASEYQPRPHPEQGVQDDLFSPLATNISEGDVDPWENKVN